MGLNIHADRIIDGKYIEVENWDRIRHSGDTDLMTQDYFEWEFIDNDDFELTCRPKDIDKAIEWVKNVICEGNQKRLIDLFEMMRGDDSIYITFSI